MFLPRRRTFSVFRTLRAERTELCVFRLAPFKQLKRLERINSNVQFAPVRATQGWLVYAHDEALVARWFDYGSGAFSGPERRIAERVAHIPNSVATFAVSRNGKLLLYSETDRDVSVLREVNRAGRLQRQFSFLGSQALQIRVSPDDRHLMFTHPDEKTGNREIWMWDLERDAEARLTSNPANDWFGVWAPDGKGFYFSSDRNTSPIFQVFFKRTLEPGGTEEQLQPSIPQTVADVSRDGRWLLLHRFSEKSQYGLMIAEPRAKTPAEILLDTEFDEWYGRFSPDGRWLGYVSDESGRSEVYVRRMAGGKLENSARVLVSRNGGEYLAWNAKGSEMYYPGPDRTLYAVVRRRGSGGRATSAVSRVRREWVYR